MIEPYFKTQNVSLYHADNLVVLENLPSESINLIYCDVLYNTKSKFTDYVDDLGSPQEAVEWYRTRFEHMHRVLRNDASIYIHCDWHLSDYLKVLLDEIFGFANFRNRLIRIQCTAKNNGSNWGRVYDEILYFVKSKNFTWNTPHEPKIDGKLAQQYNKLDANGRAYTTISLNAKGERKGETGRPWNSASHGVVELPKGRHWTTMHAELEALDKAGLVEWSKNNVPRKIAYADESIDQKCQNILDLKSVGKESSYFDDVYDTQKPIELLDKIISASSNPGDVVADFFMGSGTTAVAALAGGRKFIGCDISLRSLQMTQSRIDAGGNDLFEW
jgi:DNA modification methylase